MITQLKPSFFKLAEDHPLQRSLASASATVWTSMPVVPTGDRVGTTKLRPALEIAGHTFSPVGTIGCKKLVNSFANIELPGLEGKVVGIEVLVSTAQILSQLTSPREKTTFEKVIFYPKRLLPIINVVLELLGSSHPTLQQSLKAGRDIVAFVIKTTDRAYALVCYVKAGDADASAIVNAMIG